MKDGDAPLRGDYKHWKKSGRLSLDPTVDRDARSIRALERLAKQSKKLTTTRVCTRCGGKMDRRSPAQHCIACQTELDNA